jgi:hypothetical protein
VWPLIAALAVVTVAGVWGIAWYRGRTLSAGELMKRLPRRDTLVLSVDFDALRGAGVLDMFDGSKGGEDPDYQRFVKETNFDYRRDLDYALVGFAPDGKYLLVKGRFDWGRLRDYAARQGGGCENDFCRMAGSAPDRQISFFRLRPEIMAIAVSRDSYAARRLREAPSGPEPKMPRYPVWVDIPTSFLRSDNLPEGTHMFARTIENAESVVLAFTADGRQLGARLDVVCLTDGEARIIASDLTTVTGKLRELILREGQQPNPADLSGVLCSGTFHAEGHKVTGYWPIGKEFVESVFSGQPARP